MTPPAARTQVEVRPEQFEKALGDALVHVEIRAQRRIEPLDGMRGDVASVTVPRHRAAHRCQDAFAAPRKPRADGGEAHDVGLGGDAFSAPWATRTPGPPPRANKGFGKSAWASARPGARLRRLRQLRTHASVSATCSINAWTCRGDAAHRCRGRRIQWHLAAWPWRNTSNRAIASAHWPRAMDNARFAARRRSM